MAEVAALEHVEPAPSGGGGPEVAGRSPWALAGRRLVRNRIALSGLVLFFLIVAVSFAAPLYANNVAHVNPFENNLNGHTIVNGKRVPLMQQGGGLLHLGETPIGPTWDPAHYFLGADQNGRDVASRVLYGGRSSLEVGIGSAIICCVLATIFALLAGFNGGWLDAPNGISIGPLSIDASSLWLPTLIIAFIYLPYVYRPVRGHVLSVSEKEFVEAAIAQGASGLRLMFSEVLPNVITVVIVLLPLIIATTILTEASLSFLSVGVQPPNASWGTVISDGQNLLYTRPWVAIAPGIMIVLTVLALNVFGDGVRDALDPRAKLRVEG